MRVEHIGDATLYLGDCREILPTLGRFDACVTDPPYGIGETGRNSRQSDGVSRLGTKTRVVHWESLDWDAKPADDALIEFIRLSTDWQVIFGGNYFRLPPSPCWLVWDKLNSGDFADCELAWTNLQKAVRRIQWRWNGMIRAEKGPREHPTQKPVGVMVWCIEHLPPSTRTIIDPYCGSGTTGVACAKLGKAFTGIEAHEPYFDIACRRIAEAYRQPRLFAEPAVKPKQEGFDL